MRRRNKPLLVTAILAACCCFPSPHADHAAAAQRPNIVYILADDLGIGDVRALNPARGKIPTPNLDRLAAESMTFTDAHSGSSVCTPTRYGLLTGRYAWRTRLRSGVLSDYAQPLIAEDRLTVPELLGQHGYHSACIGKWHLGFTITAGSQEMAAANRRPSAAPSGGSRALGRFPGAPLGSITRDGPTTRGFDHFFGFHHARMMESVFEDDRVRQLMPAVEMLPALAQRGAEYVARRAKTGDPFFLYLPLSAPHTPIVPSPAWQGKSGLGPYGDFVMETDWAVGQVMAAIDEAGIGDNTLVIFTSDNGCSPQAGVEELEQQGHFSSGGLRGYKTDIWEGGHRVPFFVRWPGHVAKGTHTASLICLTDLMATLAELLEVTLPPGAGEDSFSFLALLQTDRAGASARSADDVATPAAAARLSPQRTSVVHHSIQGKFAIREASSKLCLCRGSGGWSPGNGPDAPAVQLFALDTDLAEQNNLAEAHPDEVARLTRLLESIIRSGRSTPGPEQPNDRPVEID